MTFPPACGQFVNFVEENIELEKEYATKEMFTKLVSEYEVSVKQRTFTTWLKSFCSLNGVN